MLVRPYGGDVRGDGGSDGNKCDGGNEHEGQNMMTSWEMLSAALVLDKGYTVTS